MVTAPAPGVYCQGRDRDGFPCDMAPQHGGPCWGWRDERDAPTDAYCDYRDGDGFPCEKSAGHEGRHLVID